MKILVSYSELLYYYIHFIKGKGESLRKVLLGIILLGFLYYILGFIAVKISWIVEEKYNSFSTVMGGVATLCGLFVFVLPKLTTKDVENLELESLQMVTKIAEEIN